MRKYIYLVFLNLIILLIFACSFSENGPHVVSVSISDGERIIDIESFSEIYISFSKPMNRHITEKNISISGYYENIHFQWENENMDVKLILKEPLEKGNKYTLKIKKSCESEEGYDLGDELSYNIYTYEIDDEFSVTSTSPIDGETIIKLDRLSIVINFSLPVDFITVYNKILIDPDLKYYYNFSSDRKSLTLDIVQSLNPNEIYTVTIDKELSAYKGKNLDEDYEFSFNTIVNKDNFFIQNVVMYNDEKSINLDIGYLDCTEGIEKSMELLIYFNSDFYLNTIKSLITIEPAISYRLEKVTDIKEYYMHFIFNEPMTPEEVYRITFEKSITNIYGITMDREYSFEWVVNGQNSKLFKPDKIEIIDPFELNDVTIYENVNIYQNKYMLCQNIGSYNRVDFRIKFAKCVDLYRSLDKIFLNFQNGNIGAESGDFINYSWNSSTNTLTTSFYLNILNSGGVAYYKLIITGGEDGIIDTEGNYMEENIEIYVIYNIPD